MPLTLDGNSGITMPDSSSLTGNTVTVTATTVNATTLKSTTTSPPSIQNSSGTETGQFARAWVNFDGTTTPPSIRASFNVANVTRPSTGAYVVTLTNAVTDANAAVVVNARAVGTGGSYASAYMDTASTIQINAYAAGTSTLTNTNQIHVAVFR